MDMAVDESWNNREATAVDTDSSFRNSDLVAWADCRDLRTAHEQRRVIVMVSRPINETHVMNGNRHNLPSSTINMRSRL